MKNQILTALSTIAFAAALFLAFPSRATSNAASATLTPPQERREQAEDMRRAEDKLREARALLAAAPGEFGGHRAKAIERVDEALHEVHEAWEHREH